MRKCEEREESIEKLRGKLSLSAGDMAPMLADAYEAMVHLGMIQWQSQHWKEREHHISIRRLSIEAKKGGDRNEILTI